MAAIFVLLQLQLNISHLFAQSLWIISFLNEFDQICLLTSTAIVSANILEHKEVHTFPRSISPKVKEILRLEFELAN